MMKLFSVLSHKNKVAKHAVTKLLLSRGIMIGDKALSVKVLNNRSEGEVEGGIEGEVEGEVEGDVEGGVQGQVRSVVDRWTGGQVAA